MNQAQWILIELAEGEFDYLRSVIENAGRKVTVLPVGAVYENRNLPVLDHAVVYGQQNAVEFATAAYGWLSWMDCEVQRCSSYFPRFRKHLLNSDYILVQLGELVRHWKRFASGYRACDGKLFIRPNENDKVFAAEVMTEADAQRLWGVLDPTLLVVAASCKTIHREWRCFMHGTQYLTGSLVRDSEGAPRSANVRDDVREFATGMASYRYHGLSPVWVVDVAESDAGLAVMEISDWCVSFYEADHKLLVDTISAEADLFYNQP